MLFRTSHTQTEVAVALTLVPLRACPKRVWQEHDSAARFSSLVVFLAVLTLGLMATTSQADFFGPIDIHGEVGDLQLEHTANVAGDRAVLAIRNLENEDIRCTVEFMNGPERIVKRTGFVTADREILFTAPIRRTIVKLVINYQCARLDFGTPESL